LTPVIKAFATEHGFRLASSALQVFGGYGYINEYPIGQTMRDSRIAMIYEGTNEIQANDLVLRKILADNGEALNLLLAECSAESELHSARIKEKHAMQNIITKLRASVKFLQEKQHSGDLIPALNAAPDVMQVMGYLLLAYAWLKTLRLADNEHQSDFLLKKKHTAEYYFNHLLPMTDGYFAKIKAASEPVPNID
jgi:hypothetical protein